MRQDTGGIVEVEAGGRSELSRCRQELAETRAELDRYREGVRQAATVCREAAQGNLEPRVLHVHAEGDLGEMQHGLNHLLDMTDAFVREACAALTSGCAGQFYRRFLPQGMLGSFGYGATQINGATDELAEKTKTLREARAGLAGTIHDVVETLAAAATELNATAEGMLETAGQTSAKSATAAEASTAASQLLNTVATSSDTLAGTVGAIERQAAESSEMAQRAAQEAERSNAMVGELQGASQQIGQVVKLINRVADQTRLLALNATIEAARAGEAGKGFGVVAGEVKNLAVQTAAATGQIADLVTAIQNRTSDAVGGIGGVARAVRQLKDIAATIRAEVGEQHATTRAISENLESAARGVHDVSETITGVFGATKEASTAAGQVQAAAAELSRLAERLRQEVNHFLAQLQAADSDRALAPA